MQRTDTGEFLATVGWQVSWGVDYRGQTRILVGETSERLLDDHEVITALLNDSQAPVEESADEERPDPGLITGPPETTGPPDGS